MALKESLAELFTELVAKPQLLTKKAPEWQKRLQQQNGDTSDGTGNKATNQEAAFAEFLASKGYTFLPKTKKNDHLSLLNNQGLSFIYQVNGTQQSLDFRVMYIKDNSIQESYDIDLKYSSKGEKIMLNDGWFLPNVIYLFTWIVKKNTYCFIGLQQDFVSDEEREKRAELRHLQLELNNKQKQVRNFGIYLRFANWYSLKLFTPQFIQECLAKTLTWLKASCGSHVVSSAEQKVKPKLRKKAGIAQSTAPLPQQEQEEQHSQPELPAP